MTKHETFAALKPPFKAALRQFHQWRMGGREIRPRLRQCLADHWPEDLRDRPLRQGRHRGRARRRACRQGRLGQDEPDGARHHPQPHRRPRWRTISISSPPPRPGTMASRSARRCAADIPLAIDHFRYFAGAIRAQEGGISEIDHDTVAYHFHEPLGVVGQIIPWNFPIADGRLEARAGARRRQLRRAEAGRADAREHSRLGGARRRPSAARACSTSSTASGSRPASRSPRRTASPRSPSPARRRPAG